MNKEQLRDLVESGVSVDIAAIRSNDQGWYLVVELPNGNTREVKTARGTDRYFASLDSVRNFLAGCMVDVWRVADDWRLVG